MSSTNNPASNSNSINNHNQNNANNARSPRTTIAHLLSNSGNGVTVPIVPPLSDFDLTASFLDMPAIPNSSEITTTASHNEFVNNSWNRPPLVRLISNITSSEEEFDIIEHQAYIDRRRVGYDYRRTRRDRSIIPELIPVTSGTSQPNGPTTNGYHRPPIQPLRNTFAPNAFLFPPGFPHRRLASQMLTEGNFQMSRALNLFYRQLNEIISIHSTLHPGTDAGFAHELPYEFLNIITSCFAILLNNYHQHRND